MDDDDDDDDDADDDDDDDDDDDNVDMHRQCFMIISEFQLRYHKNNKAVAT